MLSSNLLPTKLANSALNKCEDEIKMNKTAIKNFAIWARKKLISDITYKSGLIGINEKGISTPLEISTNDVQFFDVGTGVPTKISGNEIKQRDSLITYIREKESTIDYKAAFHSVMEEVAYTWFNRLIAIRFMEVNDYLPSRVRVLSSEIEGKSEPDIVTNPFDTDLEFTQCEIDKIVQFKDENKLDELFRMLFIKQCNKLNEILPELFEKTNDYTELLLNISFSDSDGIVSRLVNTHAISEEDFTEAVEIIGWMYQYYNEERKNEVINIYKGTIKKDDIPAATQLFTTDWVVRYMVDNSLGRYWIERNPDSKLKEKLEYFITSKNDEIQYVNEKISPEKLTFFDPCMGSGHILVYAFDVFMEIYRENGYTDRDAAQSIVKNNIFGLDIDKRAYQLSYFAVMMKARSYDRRFLTREIKPNISSIIETNTISTFTCDGITNDNLQNKIGEYLIKVYKNAKEIGSLITVESYDYQLFIDYLDNCNISGQLTLDSEYWNREIMPKMKKLAKQALMMSNKYEIVCTNPPYMNKMEGELKKFITKQYRAYSGDLFSVFMYRNFDYCQPNGYSAFMTPFVWMFIKTYEQLREYIIRKKSITTLVQMEYSAFEEATVPICSFVLKNGKENQKGLYFRLTNFRGGMEVQKQKVKEAISDKECGYFYETNEEVFFTIPGLPVAYWVSDSFSKSFNNTLIESITLSKAGIVTGNDQLFLKKWYEVIDKEITFDAIDFNNKHAYKWVPINKGGDYRNYYGNHEYILQIDDLWNSDKVNVSVRRSDPEYYFKPGITWSYVTSGKSSFRITENKVSATAAPCLFFNDREKMYYTLGFLNTNIAQYYLSLLNPTLNLNVTNVSSLPILLDNTKKDEVIQLVEQNIQISKKDWDSFETSWDFKKHPLIEMKNMVNGCENVSFYIKDCFELWKNYCEVQFNQLKTNEEELNSIFINIYGLNNELNNDVEDKDVTVRKANLVRDIKSFISYAVGCMFGRYSLDLDGIAYAGGIWDDSKYKTFIPNMNNCILISDEEYFEDDIIGLFIDFVQKVFGVETLEDNLDFIAKALGNKGNSPREVIRNYFVKDFYKDHIKTYQKRPIYWLYDSGRQAGFKLLIYMHRYNADTTGLVRVNYLHQMQKIYINEINRMQDMIENSKNSTEITQSEKRKEKLVKQHKEIKEYDQKIAHLALARIEINLDDGVKLNYDKVQTTQDGRKMSILEKI